MDAGQITMMPVAQAPSAAAVGNGSAASKDTGFGSLLGQTMAALEDANSLSSNALTVILPETVTTIPSVAAEKTVAEGFEVATQPNTDGDLAAIVQDAALIAQISAMQMMVVAQPVQSVKVETAVAADSTEAISSVVATLPPALNTLQQTDHVIKNQAAAEFQVPVALNTDTPVKAETADFTADAQQPQTAKGRESNSPTAVPVNMAKQAMQNKPAAAVTENAQQAVLVAMQQNSVGQQPVATIGSPAQTLKSVQESQTAPAEMAVVTKSTAPAPGTPTIRFSQASDVVVAMNQSSGEGDLSSQLGRQGGNGQSFFGTAAKSLETVSEAGLAEQLSEPVMQGRPVEHQMFASPSGQRVAATEQTVTAEQLKPVQAEQISSQVAERLVKHEIKTGHDQISLRLSPENLGNLQLNLRMEDQRLKLEIVAENRGVRDALLQQAGELKETLARQNIQMDSFNVTTGNNGSNSQQSQNWQQMTAEQRQQSTQYASRQTAGNFGTFEAPVQYFAQQYTSTIDVRF